MLTALPIVLACAGFQPCPEAVVPGVVSPRTSSPAAITRTLPLGHRSEPRPLGLENLALPRATKLARGSAAQPPLTMHSPTTMTKIMGAVAGAVAGMYAGAYLGAAIDGDCGGCDSPGFAGAMIGFPIGGVLGGVLGWNLVK